MQDLAHREQEELSDERSVLSEENRSRMASLAVSYLPAPRLRQLAKDSLEFTPDLAGDAARPDALILTITDHALKKGKLSEWMQALVTDSIIMPECREFFFKFLVRPSYYQVLAGTGVFMDWEPFANTMMLRGGQICQIYFTDDPERHGTGFLVGPDLVLTAHHVVKPYVNEKTGRALKNSGQKIKCLFDFKLDIDLNAGPGTTVPVDPKNWLVFSVGGDPAEEKSCDPERNVSAEILDFALIRLQEDFGNTAHPTAKNRMRGWMDLPKLAAGIEHASELRAALNQKPQILVGQHPGGNRLLLAVGTFQSYCCSAHRMHYKVSALKGSSGAPCFDKDWRLVGMHHAGYEKIEINQAIPIDCIANIIDRRGLLTGAALAPYDPFGVALRDGTLLFHRPELREAVERMLIPADARRILIVDGAPHSGRTMCSRFAEDAALDHRDDVLRWDAEAIQSISPEDFATRFAAAIGAPSGSANPTTSPGIPQRPGDRQPARWVARALSAWVAQRVSDSVAKKEPDPSAAAAELRQPSVWLIIENLDRFKLQSETHDLLRALMRTPQSKDGEAFKRLKLVLVGYSDEMAGVNANEITRYVTHPEAVDNDAIKRCFVTAYQRCGEDVDHRRINDSIKGIDAILGNVPMAGRLAFIGDFLRAFTSSLSKSTSAVPGAPNG
jgi:hypothetical protein